MSSSTVYKLPTIASFPSGTLYFSNTQIANTAIDISSSSLKVKFLYVDNSANTGSDVWFKLYDDTAANTNSTGVGTKVPWAIFKVAAGGTLTLVFPTGLPATSALCCACVTAGGTGGSSAPANAVSCKLWLTS